MNAPLRRSLRTRSAEVLRLALRRSGGALGILGALGVLLLAACASAPPPPPKQVLEYERHTSVGLEKHAQGYVAQARASFQRALTHAEVDDSAERVASALINLGGIELLLDDAQSAGRAYARAVREARAGKLPALEWQAQTGLAEATRRLGQPDKALELYATRPDPGKPPAETHLLSADIGRARALADAGRVSEALAVLDKVDAASGRIGQATATEASSRHARARIFLAAGRHEEALASAQAALEKDRSLHHPPSVGEDHRLIADILRALGRSQDAALHQERAQAIFAHTGQTARLSPIAPAPAGSAPR